MYVSASKTFGRKQVLQFNKEYTDFTVYYDEYETYCDTFSQAWNKACIEANKVIEAYITMQTQDGDLTRIDIYKDGYSW